MPDHRREYAAGPRELQWFALAFSAGSLTGVGPFRIIGIAMRVLKVDGRLLIRLDRGESVIGSLQSFMKMRTIPGGTLTGLGAADVMTVAFYDVGKKEYRTRRHEGLIEILNLTGNLAWRGSEPRVHVHVSAAEETAGAFGGHLVEARVSASVEISLVPTTVRITRSQDEAIGLPLLDFPDLPRA